MQLLFVIPARGGSKGIPGKNIKPLGGKPLIYYSIEFARMFTTDESICVSTDSTEIKDCVSKIDLSVPFMRPPELSTDTAGSFEVLLHAVNEYEKRGLIFDAVVLLQPTSPLRRREHMEKAINLFDKSIDMVVSVNESKCNPYFSLFEEDKSGFLKISKGDGGYVRRQDAPTVYEYNGSIYIINLTALKEKKSFKEFTLVRKVVMDEKYTLDIDTPEDWEYATYKINSYNLD